MLRTLIGVASCWALSSGCGSGGGEVKPPPTPAPVASAPPATVTAEVRGLDSAEPLSAVVRVELAGEAHVLVLASDFTDCESGEAPVDVVEGLGDERLRMVQLFCDNGEDFFQREMVTALVLTGPRPQVLWQGKGSYSNSMDQCVHTDVVHFRRAREGTIEVVRTTEVIAEPDVDPELFCEPSPERQEVVATVDVPAPLAQ